MMLRTPVRYRFRGPSALPLYRLTVGVALALAFGCFNVQAQEVVGPPTAPNRYQAEAGQPHPDFVLPRIDNGAPLRLSDLRGKKVLLVHFASW